MVGRDRAVSSATAALASAGLTSAGNELMHLWEEMDRGTLKEDEALEEANKAIRRKHGAMEKEL